MFLWIITIGLFSLAVVGRAIQIKPPYDGHKMKRGPLKTCHLAVFLGSGGHTSECLALVSSLDFARYGCRTYFVSDGDNLSIERAMALEAAKASEYQTEKITSHRVHVIKIPRARRVHQSLATTPFTAFRSLLTCLYYVCFRPLITRKAVSDVLILNGPGTCVMLYVAVYIGRMFMIPTPTTLYIESFARIKSLSLSGRLLRPFVDRFIVQWRELLEDDGRGEYHGWLV